MELRDIAASVAEHRSGNDFALVDCLRRPAAPEFLRPLLARAAGGDVPDRAYRHPNGFLKIVLLADPEFQLRLHVWRPSSEYPPPDENVHNHRWDFAAAVPAGGYRFQEYVHDARGEDFLGFRYGGHVGTSSYALTPTGDARLKCVFDVDLSAGSSYLLDSEVPHRVVGPADRTTVSLVLQGPHKHAPVEVYARGAPRSGAEVALDPLPRERVAREPARVVDLLWPAGGDRA